MGKSLYLINPLSDRPTFNGGEVFRAEGMAAASFFANATITTVAALAPDDFSVALCDENLRAVDLETDADFVGITVNSGQILRARALAKEFRSRGKTVLIGGPLPSLSPDAVRSRCDILFRGELEGAASELFSDLRAGTWKDEYDGGAADVELSPVPRWDLYPNARLWMGSVQTSRGCPFECEFCDVIRYQGRKKRHKSPGRVLAELDAVYARGFRRVFLTDDNFTAARPKAKELLAAIAAWNRERRNGRVSFTTQLSIDAADDAELLVLAREAGLVQAYVGLESPNEEALRETKKVMNLGGDMAGRVRRLYAHGIGVTASMIAGFDADGPDVFDRHESFLKKVPLPVAHVGPLTASHNTALYERAEREGRLTFGLLAPKNMTREELLAGVRSLNERLYAPEAFAERVYRFFEALGEGAPIEGRNPVEDDARVLLQKFSERDPGIGSLMNRLVTVAAKNPRAIDRVGGLLLQYAQILHAAAQPAGEAGRDHCPA